MKRRDFLKTAALGTATTLFGRTVDAAPPSEAIELARKLPGWHGFNLLEKFIKSRHNGPFLETDFQWT